MPLIDVKIVKGFFDQDQKQAVIAGMTDAIEAVYPGLRDVTFVTIEEMDAGGWGIAGQVIDAEKVQAHARKNREAEA